jgi:hypothetical protein
MTLEARMQTAKYVHWEDGETFTGYFVDYPAIIGRKGNQSMILKHIDWTCIAI